MNPRYSKQASRSLLPTDIIGVDTDMGYLDEFDVKKYVKDRLSEIKDEDEYALAKSVLYEGLYKMSEVFEERFKTLYQKVYDELEDRKESYEIAIMLLSKKEKVFLKRFYPISEEDVLEENDAIEEKQRENNVKTVYLNATDSICKNFSKDKLRVTFTKEREQVEIFVKPKKAFRYRREVADLHETFSHNGLIWDTVNTVYIDRFFDIDLSDVPDDARGVEVDYGKYSDMIKEDIYPVWNIEKTLFKSSTFLSPCNDGLYYEREMVLSKDKEVALRLIAKTEGMVSIRHEDERIFIKSYEESYSDLTGYNIFDIRYTKEELPIDLISNKRKENMIGRWEKNRNVKIHTKAEIERIIEELDISEYISLKSCERFEAVEEQFLKEEDKILPDMNSFFEGEIAIKKDSPKLILKFLRNSDSNLCEGMVRYAVSQVDLGFDEYSCVGVLENSYNL